MEIQDFPIKQSQNIFCVFVSFEQLNMFVELRKIAPNICEGICYFVEGVVHQAKYLYQVQLGFMGLKSSVLPAEEV